jgi:purine-binding chemotaxis protein CheW
MSDTVQPGSVKGNLSSQKLTGYEGRYMTFSLGGELYGTNILKVRELIAMQNVTRVPDTPPYLKGVMNLRGQVIAVLDLRLRLGLPEAERTDQTCIIIVDAGRTPAGMVVDRVQEVVDFPAGSIERAPTFRQQTDEGFILAVGKMKNGLVLLLDTEKVLTIRDEA